jgi:uncharacterized integral membrane protein
VTQESPQVNQPQPTRSTFRTWLGYFLIAFAVLFAVLNLDQVQVDWVIGTWETPLLVVILVSFALGGSVGWIAARRQPAG